MKIIYSRSPWFFLLLFITAAAGIPRAENKPAAEKEQGKIISSGDEATYHVSGGSSILREIKGENVIILKDGVKITHGEVTITSREGTSYSREQKTFLNGSVHITQKGLVMDGEECEYDRPAGRAILKHNVTIKDRDWIILCSKAVLYRTRERLWLVGGVAAEDSSTILKADSLYYDRKLQTAEVFGKVSITNLAEGFEVAGRHGFYYRNRREGLVDRDPHLVVDPQNREPATVDSDTMRFYPDSRQASAYGRVKIIKGETVTQCDSAVVFDEVKTAKLFGKPLAKQGNTSMMGDTMNLHYNDKEIDRINILGGAAIEEKQADSLVIGRSNWIQGDSMILFLNNNNLDSITVKGNSVSEYYPNSQRKVESNFVRGDSMFFLFEKDTLSNVKIIGKSDGVYKYIDLAEKETCDSLRAEEDTSLVFLPFDEKAEKVSYSADKIEFFADSKDILLSGGAKVYYQNRTLTGKQITYNSSLQLLDARGSPVLVEGGDKFYGSQMDYDLDSGVGLVREGSTRFQQGFYFGEDVAKVGDNMLKVWNSTYTTCNLKIPHYHFASREMKVYIRDKVISGPIWLYVGDTPLAYLPFMANAISKGRKSGILRPEFEFGITRSTGRFIRNFGYYWATNDYTDFRFVGDFNEDASLRMLIENRYKLRYHFNGSAQYSFYRDLGSFTNEWMLTSNHQQTLGDKFSLSSDLRFVSSDRAPNAISRIDQVADVVDRRIESRVSLRKSWNTVGFSASARRVQQLNVQDPGVSKVSTTFPDISLNIPSRNLYFGEASKGDEKPFWENVLGGIRYSPRVAMTRTTDQKTYDYTEVITQNTSLDFSSPRKVFFVNISPRLSARNNYTRTAKDVTGHTEINSVFGVPDTVDVPGSNTITRKNVFNWSTGAGMRTNFYGTFFPNLGALSGLRHTITPSATYSYNPRIGTRPASQGFSLSLTNSVDIKVKGKAGDRKIPNILIWSLSTSY